MKIVKNPEGKTEIWLTGGEIRRLERGGQIDNHEFIVYLDFSAGEEYRTNQVYPERITNES